MLNLQAFINRPIMAVSVNLILLIVGLVCIDRMELRHTSEQANNEFHVYTAYPGANLFTVEERVTKPLEDALSGLNGIKKLSSESMDGLSQIFVKFKPEIDHKIASGELRDRVMSSQSSLPETVKRPEIFEGGQSSKPILYMDFEDETRTTASLSDYFKRIISDRIKMVEGVSDIRTWGDKFYEVSIELDPARMAEYQVTTQEVMNALRQEKTFASGGEIEKESGKESVVLNVAAVNHKEFANVTVKILPTHRVKVGDIADVKIAEKNSFLTLRHDGKYTVGLQVSAKPQANPLKVSERLHRFVADLQKNMPQGMKAVITYDVTKTFRNSLKELQHTLWEAILLVGVIVTLSLASVRASLLPMVTVPLCLVGAFAIMWLLGFSVNPITLLALVLAVGLVVDDAIVVVENIHRHMEEGLSALQAARFAMKEITFAIIVMTITLAAVYLPVALQSDESAAMFREFAWTLASAVLISGFVALTLTPALCGKFLKPVAHQNYWNTIDLHYHKLLNLACNNSRKIGIAAAIIAVLAVIGFKGLGSELMPIEDEDYLTGSIFSENEVPEALRESWKKQLEQILYTIPERETVSIWEVYQRWLGWRMILKPRKERSRSANEINEELRLKFKNVVGPLVTSQVNEQGSIGGGTGAIEVVIQYLGEASVLEQMFKAINEESKKYPDIFENLSGEQAYSIPRYHIEVDPPLAAELGVGMNAIEETVYSFLAGNKVTDFNFRGLNYDVFVRAAKPFRREMSGINQFFVTGGLGQWIPLGSLVNVVEKVGPFQVRHFERMRGTTINASLKPGVSFDRAMPVLETIVKLHLPREARFYFSGAAETYQESQSAMWITYVLALLFIYLLLAALFESFIQPLIVLLTVPLSIAGAVWLVRFMGGTNNIYTAIGLVTLVGLITKHGIMIVDFSNRLCAEGKSIRDAVIQAARLRLRPILMTTLAMIAGAVPLLFSLGAGAMARHHIGWVIIGGMLTGTIFSLFVVPVAYHMVMARERQQT